MREKGKFLVRYYRFSNKNAFVQFSETILITTKINTKLQLTTEGQKYLPTSLDDDGVEKVYEEIVYILGYVKDD